MQETYKDAARKLLAPLCRVCPSCNGVACRGQVPGPGGLGSGRGFTRNVEAFERIRIRLDTLYEERAVDTSLSMFGRDFAYPFFAAPIGLVNVNYNPTLTDAQYSDILLAGCRAAGIAAFTGDSAQQANYYALCDLIAGQDGVGVPTVKPWPAELIREKLAYAHSRGAMAAACDIDASGLPMLKQGGSPVTAKSVDEWRGIIASTPLPFVMKGIMTAQGAEKAVACGAYGIVVSNHGGRVLDDAEATADVLPRIAAAVKGRIKILVDGGIRTGADVFKALALGADAVLIGRPFVPPVFGGGTPAVEAYIAEIGAGLRDTMLMTGAQSLADITREMIEIPKG